MRCSRECGRIRGTGAGHPPGRRVRGAFSVVVQDATGVVIVALRGPTAPVGMRKAMSHGLRLGRQDCTEPLSYERPDPRRAGSPRVPSRHSPTVQPSSLTLTR